MLVYVHRAMAFPNPESPSDPTVAGKEWFKIEPKSGPQAVPDWVLSTDMYAIAKQARYLEELPDIARG